MASSLLFRISYVLIKISKKTEKSGITVILYDSYNMKEYMTHILYFLSTTFSNSCIPDRWLAVNIAEPDSKKIIDFQKAVTSHIYETKKWIYDIWYISNCAHLWPDSLEPLKKQFYFAIVCLIALTQNNFYGFINLFFLTADDGINLKR